LASGGCAWQRLACGAVLIALFVFMCVPALFFVLDYCTLPACVHCVGTARAATEK
jgi:hypothetical protein